MLVPIETFGILIAGWITFCAAYRFLSFPIVNNYRGKHVVVVGGSEGISKELALVLVKQGAKVTIMARTKSKLETATKEIASCSVNNCGSISFVQIDVTRPDTIPQAFESAIEENGDIDVLVYGAGKAWTGYILEQEGNIFEESMNLNYLGAVRCAKAVIPHFLASIKSSNRTEGGKEKRVNKQICFIGSTCSVLGFLGYGSYAPCKFALKGFADSLRNELIGTGISISFACPPDTDTPGFVEECKTRPKENSEMFPPDPFPSRKVAEYILDGMKRSEYVILSPDIGQNLLIASMSGITPRNRYAPVFISFAPLIHIILIVLRMNCDRVARKYGKKLLSVEVKKEN